MSATSPVVVAALGLLVGAQLGAHPAVATTTATTSSPTPVVATATLAAPSKGATSTVTLKPYAAGNTSRGFGPLSALASPTATGISSVVVDTTWAALEPTQGTYTTAPIDGELRSAASMGLTVRLRVLAGTQAPAYAKAIGGTPIPFYDHQLGAATTIGRFWLPAYQTRWQDLMRYLAGKYDGNPLIGDVNISGTGVVSAEVMLTMGNDTIPGSTVTNNDRLIAAGATETARRTALMNDIAFMQRTWAHTHTTLFCHPYVSLSPSPTTSLATTEQIISTAYAADPGATVFGHTGASQALLSGTAHSTTLDMYEFLIDHHYPFMAQTQTYGGGAKNEGVGDLSFVVTWLASHGAFSVELPNGWDSDAAALPILPATTRQMLASASAG